MLRDCFESEIAEDTYTSAEVVSELQGGVRVKTGMGSAQAKAGLTKRVKFGTPVHSTLERLSMTPTSSCAAKLAQVPTAQLETMYAVQEVLTAEISEQTYGRLDASGKFGGAGRGRARDEPSLSAREYRAGRGGLPDRAAERAVVGRRCGGDAQRYSAALPAAAFNAPGAPTIESSSANIASGVASIISGENRVK